MIFFGRFQTSTADYGPQETNCSTNLFPRAAQRASRSPLSNQLTPDQRSTIRLQRRGLAGLSRPPFGGGCWSTPVQHPWSRHRSGGDDGTDLPFRLHSRLLQQPAGAGRSGQPRDVAARGRDLGTVPAFSQDFLVVATSARSCPAGTFRALAILSRMRTVGFRTPRSMPLCKSGAGRNGRQSSPARSLARFSTFSD